MHIFRHKFISILFALGQKKMFLKNDQLEVSGSVFASSFRQFFFFISWFTDPPTQIFAF